MTPTLRNKRIAVIGGTGFIGSHLVEHLLELGNRVWVLSRNRSRTENLSRVAGEYVFLPCDIMSAESLSSALGTVRPSVIFHLAGAPDAAESFAHMSACVQLNTLGTVHVMQAAAAAGAQVVVYGDSSKDYGNGGVPYRIDQPQAPVCSYAISKTAGWDLCRVASSLTGVAVCALRPTFVYGPRQNWNLIKYVQQCARTGVPVRLLGGSQTRDLLYVDDVVRAFVAAAASRSAWGQAIPVGGGREVPISALSKEILRIIGSNVEVLEDAMAPRMTEIWRSFCDNTEAAQLLRWFPEVPIDEGLMRTLAEAPPVFRQSALSAGAGLTEGSV